MNTFLGILLFIFPILKGGHWGFVNQNGEKVLDTQYDYISSPNAKGFYIVANGVNYGLVDSSGKEILKVENRAIRFYFDSLIAVQKDNNWDLLSAEYKKMVNEPIVSFEDISPSSKFYDTSSVGSNTSVYLYTTQSGKKGFFSKGNFLSPEYTSWKMLSNKYFQLQKLGKEYVTNLNLKLVNSSAYDEITELGAYYLIKQNQKQGVLNPDFSVMLKSEFKDIKFVTLLGKPYLVYKKLSDNAVSIFDIETKKEILNLPFSAVEELENGDIIEPLSNDFPRFVQVKLGDKVGVYDVQTKQIVLTPQYKSIGYIGKSRFVIYDNYSKLKIAYNNKIVSKDTIVGFIHPFDSLPVTYFYKDILYKGKIGRFYGAFNLNGEVLVPFPVSHLKVYANKITFTNAKGNNSVVKYDASSGKFEEYIDNYHTLTVIDTNQVESIRRVPQKCINPTLDFTKDYQFILTDKTLMIPKTDYASFLLRGIYSGKTKECAMGGILCIDADIDNLNKNGIGAFFAKDLNFKFIDMNKKKFIDAFHTDANTKGPKKKFSFITRYNEGMAAVNFTTPEQKLEDRFEANKNYFGGYTRQGIKHLYSDNYVPLNYIYHRGNWGFVDSTGTLSIFPKYSRIQLFNKGVAIVEEGNRMILINKKGQNVANRSFLTIERLESDTLFLVKELFMGVGFLNKSLNTLLKADKRGLIDVPGNNIYPIQAKNKKWGYRHFNGTWITDTIYTSVKPFVEGYAALSVDGKWGFIDTTGKLITQLIYADVTNMQCGRAFVKPLNKNSYSLINSKGEPVGNLHFDNVHAFEQELAIVNLDGKFGVIDHLGNWVYKNEFTSIDAFNVQGEAKAVKEGKTYIISSEKNIQPFDKNEMAYTKKAKNLNEKEIAKYNELILNKMQGVMLYNNPKLYYKSSIEETKYLPFIQPYKVGLMTKSGTVKLEPQYQYITKYYADIFKVYKDNEIGYYSLTKGWLYKPW